MLALVRARLERARGGKTGSKIAGRIKLGALRRARTIIELSDLSDEEVERAVVAGLLEEEFGSELTNSAAFQRLVDDVSLVLRNDEQAGAVLTQAVAEIRSQAE